VPFILATAVPKSKAGPKPHPIIDSPRALFMAESREQHLEAAYGPSGPDEESADEYAARADGRATARRRPDTTPH
jgi:hypothetical protein